MAGHTGDDGRPTSERYSFGYLAYVNGQPAGWVNASSRSDYGLYRRVDPDGPEPQSVIGVSCFLIAPPFRRHGVASALLDDNRRRLRPWCVVD